MTDWVIDLDGVMWTGKVPIPGSVEAVATLLARGDRVVFCTNNSMESGEARAARLVTQGIAPGFDVVTSADAVCSLIAAGERTLVLGGPGLAQTLSDHGALPTQAAGVDPAPLVATASAASGSRPDSERRFDAVVVGLTRDFDYRQMDVAAAAVRAGARLVATNDDATYPGADGIHPGAGSLVAAVETASETKATVAGKPLGPMCDLIVSKLALGERNSPHDRRGEVIVVGDRPDTDGRLAENLGVRFGLVLSGVTTRADLPVDTPTALVAADLATLVSDPDVRGSASQAAL